ncbi:MAG: DUF1993 domain-containing protein [Bdellovibrionales bacterium]|nr:DUF1993 domain-containing protein [Bdellovibrionales bacterium]
MNIKTIFQFKKMLLNLDQCMVKAAAFADHKKFDVNLLAGYRLAPDMYPFSRQVQSACDAAKFCAAYLAGQTAPKHPDTETTWAELRERIAKVVAYLETFKDGDFSHTEVLKIKPGWAQGQWLHAEEYVHEVAIPNFYFHLMAGYAIIRHAGVDIGKMDYLGKVDTKP